MWRLTFTLVTLTFISAQMELDLQPADKKYSDEDDCECVPYHLCDNGQINTDGGGIIRQRFQDDCNDDSQVCCKKEDLKKQSIVEPVKSEGCSCVPKYLCSKGYINTDGEGFINSRSGDVCDDDTFVCCEEKDQQSPEPVATKNCDCMPANLCENRIDNIGRSSASVDLRQVKESCSDKSHVCCEPTNQKLIQRTNEEPPKQVKSCGMRNPRGLAATPMAKENESEFGEFPWVVAILSKNQKSQNSNFGGALIHPQVVITAAHCLTDTINDYTVRAGAWDRNANSEPYLTQDRTISSATIHPKFNMRNSHNDIAFLYLSSPFDISPHIDIICLPAENSNVVAERCYSTGWGKNSFGKKGRWTNALKKIDLPVVPNGACQEKLRKTVLGTHFKLDGSFMCAGGEEGKDACTGDGGSPLVCPIEGQQDRFYQAGIVSWGLGCGEKDIPGAYVNVAAFRGWIDGLMASHQLTYNYTY